MTDPTKKPVEKPQKENIYTAFTLPFYISAIIGLLPFSIPSFMREKKLKTSWVGNIWCILNMINLATHYHFAISQNYSEDESAASKSSEKLPPPLNLIATFITQVNPHLNN